MIQQNTAPTISVMDADAVNEYLDKLMAGKFQVKELLEQRAVESFRQISGRVDSLSAALRRAENQVEGFKAEIASASGEMKAYANVLAGAEDARRAAEIEAEKAEAINKASPSPDKGGNGKALKTKTKTKAKPAKIEKPAKDEASA